MIRKKSNIMLLNPTPSVQHLKESKKEFMIYESTFSDVLGIMVFSF